MIPLLFLVGLGFFAVERLWPANELPKVHAWWPRVILINALNIILVMAIGAAWTKWIAPWSVFKLSGHLPYYLAGLIAYLVSCFAYYWWHRFRHESDFFWRVCHQLHHSPQRIEVVMAFYKHPLEIFLNAVLSSAISYGLLGCSVEAAAVCSVLACLAEFFYHWNIRTPVWLGYLVQRPESHRIHHERAQHTSNYADLAVLDMLFGTFRNSRKGESVECGFDSPAEDRFEDILVMRDVNGQAAGRPPLHFLPTCIGCHKRWACHEARTAKIHGTG
jgi:sterol desaturase/sphingolipid hydroxylase (fatty acid hydroxylase superfamily)